jgi:hypothetical protein
MVEFAAFGLDFPIILLIRRKRFEDLRGALMIAGGIPIYVPTVPSVICPSSKAPIRLRAVYSATFGCSLNEDTTARANRLCFGVDDHGGLTLPCRWRRCRLTCAQWKPANWKNASGSWP